jgi:AraC family transcriptional regulator
MIGHINIQPAIQMLSEKKLVGKRVRMTFADNQTFKLWQSFMPRRSELVNSISADLISLQVYPELFDLAHPDPDAGFEKWATLEVADFSSVPDGMETLILQCGLYAVFHYRGLSNDTKIFQYIFGIWFPASAYLIDNRPHFEVLGEKYRNNDPESEEEIWIPVREKR